MVEERRWPLGNKVTQLDAGYGLISTIKWKETLIAWANEKVTALSGLNVFKYIVAMF